MIKKKERKSEREKYFKIVSWFVNVKLRAAGWGRGCPR